MAISQKDAVADVCKSILASLKEVSPQVDKLKDMSDKGEMDFPDGISLWTVKVDALLAYLHHMTLLCAHRLSRKSLADEQGGEYVERLVRLRLVLEKMRPMETRIKYQVEKLLQAATAAEKTADIQGEDLDLLTFRPNPKAFSTTENRQRNDMQDQDEDDEESTTYKPPKLAPVLYDPDARPSGKERNRERQPSRNTALLADLTLGMSSNPYETSTAGVGGGGVRNTGSSRARALQRMQDFEEDNYKRLSMSKKDAKRRRRDEQDVALGGLGLSSHKDRIGGGIEEEFGDLLRGRERDARHSARGQGAYDLLEQRAAKQPSTAQRAQSRSQNQDAEAIVPGSASTRRFKKAMRSQRRKTR
ncbi:hypothetical protein MYAM1_003264 [Malassezia yamatoensis]|uniref:Neuroguidin n=1 Tax=Malassezia yamatoensis TaxID=253288 RepID=A0AAJ6CI28_9BASI|nr:hypothetical protein MYAM1_003264 [Malassezia yamatoensis]